MGMEMEGLRYDEGCERVGGRRYSVELNLLKARGRQRRGGGFLLGLDVLEAHSVR